ncbi:unnamed protein product [Soboliphyme baturini]|uniref:Uncharacterized protein n=1 Tax=Soboliphyme baturini TaxID=241478 RepID=A0A183J4S2_9BILA|nr:unnamed protein product [Soboliphyme baturini]
MMQFMNSNFRSVLQFQYGLRSLWPPRRPSVYNVPREQNHEDKCLTAAGYLVMGPNALFSSGRGIGNCGV